MPQTSCPCGPDQYYCELPGYACSVLNILGKASYIVSKSQPGYWNDLDMLEVGNGAMSFDEYKTHFGMWSLIKSPLLMRNDWSDLSEEECGIQSDPAILAISQDEAGTAVQRKWVQQVDDKDEYGFGEVQCWSGGLANGDYVVAFVNAANNSRMVSSSLVDVFGGLSTNTAAQQSWSVFDLWGNQTVVSNAVASQILNGTAQIANTTGYYNASAMSWSEGVARNESLLFGTPVGMVQAGGTLNAEVARHGTAMFRLRPLGGSTMRKRDEL